jgi:hypothetical protein
MELDPKQKVIEVGQSPVLPPWIEQYRWSILGGVAAIGLVVVGVLWSRSGAERAKQDAFQRLMTSQTPNDLMAVTTEYPDSQAAPLAMMKLAKSQFDQGSFEEALKNYEQFSLLYADHELSEGAVLGRLHCLEAMGRTEDALKGFEEFQKGPHFLTPQAVIAQARCLRTLNRPDDARVVYEDFITANPSSPWNPRFKELLDEVAGKKADATSVTAEIDSESDMDDVAEAKAEAPVSSESSDAPVSATVAPTESK